VSAPALPCALLAALLSAGAAQAHRLDAQAFVLPGQKVQIESWFSSGDAAKHAKVEVFRAGHQLLTEGQTDEQGIFVFPFARPESLQVVISAGAGHRKELAISAADLAPTAQPSNDVGAVAPVQEDAGGEPRALAKRETGAPIKDVITGIGFLLALGAFLLSLRNARQLRRLDAMSDQKKA